MLLFARGQSSAPQIQWKPPKELFATFSEPTTGATLCTLQIQLTTPKEKYAISFRRMKYSITTGMAGKTVNYKIKD
jgi:hypothetical protein